MDKSAEIKRLLQEVVTTENGEYIAPFTAIVTAVEGDFCTVEIDDIELTDVNLKATIGAGDNQLLMTPKVGSKVMLISLNGKLDNLAVIKMDEPEMIAFKQEGLEILLDGTDGKVSIKNDQASLLDLLTELKTLIEGLTVSTGVGPSGTPLPPTIQALATFEQNFNNLLK